MNVHLRQWGSSYRRYSLSLPTLAPSPLRPQRTLCEAFVRPEVEVMLTGMECSATLAPKLS